MDIGLIAVVFIGGMLFDHFVLNKLAGLVAPEVAKVQADLATIAGKLGVNQTITHVVVPAAPAPAAPAPAPPLPPGSIAGGSVTGVVNVAQQQPQ